MKREDYLARCRAFAILPKGVHDQPIAFGDHLQAKVLRYGKAYYAKSYLLDYDQRGAPRHTAIVRELNNNCVLQVPLASLVEPSVT